MFFSWAKAGLENRLHLRFFSVFLAQKGFKVLIVSLDPAHNQSDIFERSLSDKPIQITPNLSAIEIDQEFWIRQYLKDIHNQINRTYSYLTAFNLEKYFSVIKYSPGLEEYALILAFEKTQKKFSRCDYLIFDMPPTALGLKFFSLPSLSLIWIEHLLALRKEIIKKRDLITNIKLIKKEIERDKVLNKINELQNQYQALKDTFEDRKQTQINLVLNPDKLSYAESIRIVTALQKININLHRTISNKMKLDSSFEDINEVFAGIPMINFPYSETPLIGIHNLQEFIKTNRDQLEKQLSISSPNPI